MRISIMTGQSQFSADLASLLKHTTSVLDSFTAIKNDVHQMNGGVGILQDALGLVETRIQNEEQRLENLKQTQKAYDQFLENTLNTDREVAQMVEQNQEEFYKVNPWARPSIIMKIRELAEKILKLLRGDRDQKQPNFILPHILPDPFHLTPFMFFGGVVAANGLENLALTGTAGGAAAATSGENPINRSYSKFSTGDKTKEGTIFGLESKGKFSADALGYSVSQEKSDSHKYSDGRSIEGHVGQVSGEGSVGWASGNFGISAINGDAIAEYGVGKGIYGNIEANVSAIKGEIDGGIDTKYLGTKTGASGDLLDAGAGAGLGIGQQKDGSYGISAHVKAAANIANGEVHQEINVLGLKVRASVSGSIGSAGVDVGGYVTNRGIGVNGAIALGAGAGLDLSIDWNGVPEKVNEIAEDVKQVANNVKNVANQGLDLARDAWHSFQSLF